METTLIAKASIDIQASAKQVWDAMTNPEKIKLYLFGTNAKSDWKVGSPVVFSGEWENQHYEDKGFILESVPNKILAYNYWSSMSGIPDLPENYRKVTYRIEDKGTETTLTILQESLDEEKREHSEQSWKSILETIKNMLENSN